MENRYDIVIIGTGPAGISAAINARIRNKSIIIFGSKELTNKLIKAPKIDNFLGFYNISGFQLKENFQKHIDSMGIVINEEKVKAVYAMGDYFSILANDNVYEAASVIIATGLEFTKSLKGEMEYLGRGVGYCATCDAPLYRGKDVVIVGYNEEAEEEANFVSEMSKHLYYVPMKGLKGKLRENIEVIEDIPLEIVGDDKVKALKLKGKEISVDGIFILKDSMPPAQLVPGIEIVEGHIQVNRNMATNIEGCFAAGDCTGRPYQYMKAAGEGQVAALSAVSYLDKR
ncbi:MAG TPA: NAD(P)/FAD-dependent oxidoreductase [Clostridiaceae bacterium]